MKEKELHNAVEVYLHSKDFEFVDQGLYQDTREQESGLIEILWDRKGSVSIALFNPSCGRNSDREWVTDFDSAKAIIDRWITAIRILSRY